MRIGCLYVPDLPLQALLRMEPTLAGSPIAVTEGEGARARIRHVSIQARAAGVLPGLGIGEGLSLCPQLVVREVATEIRESARGALLDAARSVSPRVEEGAPGFAWIDGTGLDNLHVGERGVASALVAAAARVGLDGRAAVASGKRLSLVAAMRGEGIEVVPRGAEPAFLAPLSVAALGASQGLYDTLLRWGVPTAGAFAALPVDGVGSRLGAEGVRLHRLCRGIDDEPLHPLPEPEVFEEGCDFDFELQAVEGLLFVLRPALERLITRLDCHGVAVGGLTLRLILDPGEALLPVELAAPTRDVPSLLSLCRSILERRPPGAAVRGVRVIASPSRTRKEQLRLFGLPTVPPEKLATAVAKVAAIVGDDRVGRPMVRESHDPDAWDLGRFEPPPPPEESLPPVEEKGPVGFRYFRPPLEAEVRMGPDGPQSLRAGSIAGWIVSCAGPWRLDVGWHDTPTRSDSFDVELSDGGVYRLKQAQPDGRWALVGRYD